MSDAPLELPADVQRHLREVVFNSTLVRLTAKLLVSAYGPQGAIDLLGAEAGQSISLNLTPGDLMPAEHLSLLEAEAAKWHEEQIRLLRREIDLLGGA